MAEHQRISIIVSSYDSARRSDIRALLFSLKRQERQNFELITVVEQDMALVDIVSSYTTEFGLRPKIVVNEGPYGLSEARNLGAKEARGDFLAFVDDDVMLMPQWTKAVEDAFCTFQEIYGITGPARPYWVEGEARWMPRELDWLIGCTRWFRSDHVVLVRNCWGMNMAFRRAIFDSAGGFSNATGFHRGKLAEDLEFSLRIQGTGGGKIAYIPEMEVFNRVRSNRFEKSFLIERSSWIGHSRRSIRKLSSSQLDTSYESMILGSTLLSLVRFDYLKGLRDLSDLVRLIQVTALVSVSLVLGYLLGPRLSSYKGQESAP